MPNWPIQWIQAHWIIDTMTIMRSIKSKKTCKEWLSWLTKILTPNKHCNPESIEFVCDTYCWISSKSCTLTERGESGKRDYLQIEHQSMITRKNWVSFFYNIENKKDLWNLFAIFIWKSCFRDISDVSVVITNNMES